MKTIKVPKTQHRSAKLMVSGEGETKKISMSISSDVPYLRYDWWNDEEYYELLSHSPGDINEERLKAGLPILFNHNRDDHLGRAGNYENDGHKCTLTDLAFSESDFAQSKMRDALSGVLPDTSVGYTVDDEGVCVGEKDGIPIYKFGWTPFEGSLVTVPADITVGMGRERDLPQPKGEPREIRILEKNVSDEKNNIDTTRGGNENGTTTGGNSKEMKRHKFFREADQGDNNQGGSSNGAATIDAAQRIQITEEAERKATDKERKRVADIQDLNARFRKEGLAGRRIDSSAVAQQCIKEGKSVAEFQDLCVRTRFEELPEVVVTDDEDPHRSQGDGNNRRNQRSCSIGAEFIRSKQFQDMGKRTGERRSVAVDYDFGILGARGKVAMATRAGFTSNDLSAVNVQIQSQVVGLGMQRLTVMDLLTGGATDAAAIIYPRENTFGFVDGVAVASASGGVPGMPRAKTVGERGLKPNWDPDLTTATANVKKIAITTKVPDEFMADFPAAQSYIDGRLPFMVDTETEFQLLYGSGIGNDMLGLYTTQGTLTRAIDSSTDTNVAKSLRKGLTDIQVGSFFEPDGYVFHPYDWETASLLQDSNGRFLAGGPFYIPYTNGVFLELYTFWGKPVVKTTACTYGKPVAGCFKLGAQYFMREGMRIQMTNANEDDFKRNLVALRCEHRLALANYRPMCFLEYSAMPART